jgi:hypothetical protein
MERAPPLMFKPASRARAMGDTFGRPTRTKAMKATEVRILPALDPGDSYVDPTFMLVETALDENGDPVTTMEHVASRLVGDNTRWQIVTLGQAVPLSHAAALEWAVSFAASRNIPVVYERDTTVLAGHAAAPNAGAATAHSNPAK